jgi:hypothetical protein
MADPNAAAVPDANAAPVPDPVFALVPGDFPGVIDYSTRQGLAIYNESVKSLYQDSADLFNVESAGLQTFLSLLTLRGTISGWDFEVPQDNADPHNNLLNLLTNHGRFSLDHLREFAQTFVNNQSRAAQMNIQMVKCILASLSLPGFRKVHTWHTDWHIGDRPAAHLLVKVIIREAYIDTQATTRILREHLSSLPAKLDELKGDIDQLNAFVKVTQDQLAARGETSNDLLANLFKGYLSSKDVTFRRYIDKKQEDYDDGTPFTVDGLMNMASNKFKTLVESGKWMAPTDEQAKIIALEAKLSKMGTRTAQSSSNNRSSTQKKNNSKSSKKKGGKKEIPDWMTKWPGKEFVESGKSMVKEGRTYWWCKKHKRFCMHKTSECRLPSNSSGGGNQKPPPGPSNNNNGSSNGPKTTPSIRVSTATMMDE